MPVTLTPPRTLELVTVGNPNIGKTTLINALSGADLQVGNWPGTTVDRLQLRLELEGGRKAHLVDLPGTYSLAGANAEEAVARAELLRGPDVIINVLDAGNLERNLYLTLELCELGLPMVAVLNLVDEAAHHGIEVEAAALEAMLGIPVVTTIASQGKGLDDLRSALDRACRPQPQVRYHPEIEAASEGLERLLEGPSRRWMALAVLSEDFEQGLPSSVKDTGARSRSDLVDLDLDCFLEIAQARFERARAIVSEVCRIAATPTTFTQKLDRIMLNRWLGIPLFLLGMLLVFRFTFLFSKPWIDWMASVQALVAGWIACLGLPPLVESFLSKGLVEGLGTILAFAPVLFCLYLAMSFLEASGFLARTAFVCDKLMKMVGLPGRAFIPLLLGFGCNVPAIYATRALAAPSDRLRVSMAIPFMACSARLTVFTLFAAVFFPRQGPWVVFGLYLMGLALGLGTSWLMRGLAWEEGDRTGLMEMPPYRIPSPRVVLRQATNRTSSFVKGAGGPILVAVLVVWMLLALPPGPPEASLYGQVSRMVTTPLAPLGIHDWRLAGALIPGFIAKEVVVGTLGVSYLGPEPVQPLGLGEGLQQLATATWTASLSTLQAVPQLLGLPSPELPKVEAPNGLREALGRAITPSAALAYLVLVLLYTPCVATVGALRQEFGTRWALFSLGYQVAVAYLCAWLVHLVY